MVAGMHLASLIMLQDFIATIALQDRWEMNDLHAVEVIRA